MFLTPENKEDLMQLVDNKVEENLQLEYKSAEALGNTDGKKKEIAKDVSSMANSAGGTIIYGIREFDVEEKKHLPEKITPVNRKNFSKETLEQIINSNISPKIEGLIITAIQLEKPEEVCYSITIPQSTTAHQNTADGRYYRRRNFIAEWMHDYEIKDILNRQVHPQVTLFFKIIKKTRYRNQNSMHGQIPTAYLECHIQIYPINFGKFFAKYVNYYVQFPNTFIDGTEKQRLYETDSLKVEFYGENTFRDVVDHVVNQMGGSYPKFGPSRFDPILPGLKGRSESLKLKVPIDNNGEVTWIVHADNALPIIGRIKISEIVISEEEE